MKTLAKLALLLGLACSSVYGADFTLNGPGTTNDPWTPTNIIIPVGSLKSDASGFRDSPFSYSVFAHNTTYGATITSTVTVGTATSGDELVVGAVVRTGGNAGCMIGVYFQNSQAIVATMTAGATRSSISSATALNTNRTAGDVYEVTVTIVGGTATITAKQNGATLTFSSNTTTTYAAEATLAAGASFDPQNSNGTRLSKFEGTGVSGGGGGGAGGKFFLMTRRWHAPLKLPKAA